MHIQDLSTLSKEDIAARRDALKAQAEAADSELRQREYDVAWKGNLDAFVHKVLSVVDEQRALSKDERAPITWLLIPFRNEAHMLATEGYEKVLQRLREKLKISITFEDVPMKGQGYAETDEHLMVTVDAHPVKPRVKPLPAEKKSFINTLLRVIDRNAKA